MPRLSNQNEQSLQEEIDYEIDLILNVIRRFEKKGKVA